MHPIQQLDVRLVRLVQSLVYLFQIKNDQTDANREYQIEKNACDEQVDLAEVQLSLVHHRYAEEERK